MLSLEMLPADYGDCLWLEYGQPGAARVVLIDGGPGDTYRRSIRPRIEAFARQQGRTPRIELLVVTHIDNDHIVGTLDLLRDPDVEVGEVWFNGWDQISDQPVTEVAVVRSYDRGQVDNPRGVKEGVALSQLIQARRLSHNTHFGGKAAAVDPDDMTRKYTLPGGLALTLLSPGPKQLNRLRDEWSTVLAEAEGVTTREFEASRPTAPDVEELAARKFQPDNAPANGSSIALLAEYDGRRLLLAADSFAPVVADSLLALGYSEMNRLPLDAYKLSHHGSRGNNSRDLLRLVRCRDYLFSTSGARFRHPHDECVARVLVESGEGVRIHTNYRRGPDMLWSLEAVVARFRHELFQPPQGAVGLSLGFDDTPSMRPPSNFERSPDTTLKAIAPIPPTLSVPENLESPRPMSSPEPNSPSAPLAPSGRVALVRTISGLSPGDFAQLVSFIAGAASHVSRHGTVAEHAAELIGWAESSTGPGLAAIQEALESFR